MEDFRIYVTINDEDIKRHNKDIIKVVIVTACIAIFFGVINAFLPEDESVKTVAGVKGLLISSLLLCGICSISAFDFAKKIKVLIGKVRNIFLGMMACVYQTDIRSELSPEMNFPGVWKWLTESRYLHQGIMSLFIFQNVC